MCGIIGVISGTDVVGILSGGLKELQNRGYDSIGFGFLRDDQAFVVRKGPTKDADGLLSGLDTGNCRNGIAHSRWATHGSATESNAHPHISYDNTFCLAHNGIIENFQELKTTLPPGTPFLSETDTEVIAHLIAHAFEEQKTDLTLPEKVCRSICAVTKKLRGTYGLVVQCRLLPRHLFCIRYGSPLVVGVSAASTVVASEKSAFPPGTTKCFAIEDHDLVILEDDRGQPIRRFSGGAQAVVLQDNTPEPLDGKQGFATWTEKEIWEQPEAIQRCLKNGSRIMPDNTGVKLGGLTENKEKVSATDHVVLMGCGTSHHACLLAAHYFRTMENRLQTTQVCDASEFSTSLLPKAGNTTLIVVSQSGETMDLLVSIRRFRQARPDALVLGVVNVVDSAVATKVDGGVYTNSGRERGVASTKSFTTQVLALYMVACAFSTTCHNAHLQIVRNLPLIVRHNLSRYFEEVRGWACGLVSRYQNLFIVGKSFDHWVAMEAALKIKEISYIHAEAHSSSSLKHGPFALLGEDMLVVLLSNTPSERSKLENAYEEIRARQAPILVVSYENIHDCPYYIHIPYHYFSYLEANMVVQVLALELSLSKGIHPDYPKNLAKVVTVE